MERAVQDLVAASGFSLTPKKGAEATSQSGGLCWVDVRSANANTGELAGENRGREVGEPVGMVGAAGIGAGDHVGRCCGDPDVAAACDRSWRTLQTATFIADGNQGRVF